MKTERFSVKSFNQQFPNDAACLEYIWQQRFPSGAACQCGKVDTFYRVERRKCYSCSHCGHQISPCEGTIFHKSSTSLKTWFYAMFLMTASKNGISAKELERLTGVTYKTAWRMAHHPHLPDGVANQISRAAPGRPRRPFPGPASLHVKHDD